MRERFACHADDCACANSFHKDASVVALPDGDLFAAWFAGEHRDGHRDLDVYGSRLPAGDDEWTDAVPLAHSPDRAFGAPVVFVGPGDALWLVVPQMYGNWMVSGRLFYKRSFDGGRTWTDLELLHDRHGLVPGKNAPLRLEPEDRWLLGVDILHGAENKAGFLLLEDDLPDRPGDFPPLVGGDSLVPFDEDGYVGSTPGMAYATAVELGDGTIRAYLRPRPRKWSGTHPGYLYRTHSTDRGLTWAEAELTTVPNPDAGFDVRRLDSGALLLVNNPVQGGRLPEGRNELALFLSDDEGETWPVQWYLECEDPERSLREMDQVGRPEFTYGNVVQADDGTVHVVYEYRRQALKHVALTESEIRERGRDEPIVPGMAG